MGTPGRKSLAPVDMVKSHWRENSTAFYDLLMPEGGLDLRGPKILWGSPWGPSKLGWPCF